MEQQLLMIYKIDLYDNTNAKFIKTKGIVVDDIDEMKQYLASNCGYHFRIKNNTRYIFFGDLDEYENDIEQFIELLRNFMEKKYNLIFFSADFKYTQSSENKNSYHYSIPKWNLKTEKLKEIHINFYKENEKYLKKKGGGKCVDTSIYSPHWFRCPYQKKGTSVNDTSEHKIIVGFIEDFVVEYIPKNSVDINNVTYKSETIVKKNKQTHELLKEISNDKNTLAIIDNDDGNDNKKKNKLTKKINTNKNTLAIIDNANEIDNENKLAKEIMFSSVLTQPMMYKKLFDECYKEFRFNEYEIWLSVGMALKNSNLDESIALDLFDYFSAKSHKYDGFVEIEKKFKTFIKKKTQNKYTVATIYYYAIEDNKPKFIEILSKNTFDLEQSDMCKYVKMLAGKIFVYIGKKLYCFDGKIWRQDDILFRHFLSNELYEFLKIILIELYFDHRDYMKMHTQIKRLKMTQFKKDIVETYREVGSNTDLCFDTKWNLIGFNNIVYDLEEEQFREYKYDDYISTTTGYDWIEPTEEEIVTVKKILRQIMPIPEEYDVYMQILASGLDGKFLEKFVIFSGNGGNGKGLVDDLMLVALGNYAMIGNNSILFETNKTGSNPEKANIHKKRFLVFREPSEKKKFENSVIKELTGGGTFSSRGHHETDSKKELNITMVVECNKKPIFAEEPTNADVRRIIDIYFRSTYTDDASLVDENEHIYLANPYYKTFDFQQKHKYALMKILMEEHKKYKKNDYMIHLPKSIKKRTQNYLDMSFTIVQWFKSTYTFTKKKSDFIKVKDLYCHFTESRYFNALAKQERQKYSKIYFNDYIATTPFFKKYYIKRTTTVRNIIQQWKQIDEDDDGGDDDDDNDDSENDDDD